MWHYRLLAMTEFQREQILEERLEEKQKLQNARTLADMVRQQQRNGGASADDSHSRGAKRMSFVTFEASSLIVTSFRPTSCSWI